MSKFRSRILAEVAVALAVLRLGAPLAHAAEPIELAVDMARVLKLEQPADTIAIGNSNIADATVIDATTLVLTGKSTGRTNIIVLGRQGSEYVNYSIQVGRQAGKYISVHAGDTQKRFVCNSTCESAPQANGRSHSDGPTDVAATAVPRDSSDEPTTADAPAIHASAVF